MLPQDCYTRPDPLLGVDLGTSTLRLRGSSGKSEPSLPTLISYQLVQSSYPNAALIFSNWPLGIMLHQSNYAVVVRPSVPWISIAV